MTMHIPSKINAFDDMNVIFIDAKKAISCAITEAGEVYTWGKSKDGVLGFKNSTSVNVNLPTKVTELDNIKIKYLSCGQNHVAAISENGEVYTWG